MTTMELLQKARGAKTAMALADTDTKNRALLAMADALEGAREDILAANEADLADAQGHISQVMLDRLALNPGRIAGMAQGIREVAALPDPVGAVLKRVERPNGLVIEKTAVPMGVIAIIYESRPNVTSDAAVLALKAGSACVLRGGQGGPPLRRRHRGGPEAGPGRRRPAPGRPDAGGGHQPGLRQRADDRLGLCGSADSPGGRGAHPGLCGQRHRPRGGDGHRHLPRLCGRGRRPGHGPEHCGERQVLPPLGVQRRGGAAGPPGRGGGIPAQAEGPSGG